MKSQISKVKNVFGNYSLILGEIHKDKFEDVKPSEISTDGQNIDVNTHLMAISWQTGGAGIVSIIDNTKFDRIPTNQYFVRGHNAAVCDIKFSPFKSNLLATACEDATLRIFDIPQEGLTQDINDPVQSYQKHLKKINICNWNPVVSEVIASCGIDNKINIYNILSSEVVSSFNFSNSIMSIEWNDIGSLVGVTTKDKNLSVYDPRSNLNEIVKNLFIRKNFKCHDSSRYQKMIWLSGNVCFSVGFSSKNERQYKLWDLKNYKTSLQTQTIDSLTGVLSPFWDADTSMIYLPGKGEGNLRYYEYKGSSVSYINEYKSSVAQKSVAFFPKRAMNYNKCEIARAAKLTSNSVEYLSFYIPKRVEGYHVEVYPDCVTGIPNITVEEWLKGENRPPLRKPINTIDNRWVSMDESKISKSPTKESQPNSQLPSQNINLSSSQNESLIRKVNELTKTIENLNVVSQEDKQIIEILSTKVVAYEEEIEQYQQKIGELENEIENLNNELAQKDLQINELNQKNSN